jgi:ATP-dependent DNA helicase RecG
MKDILKYNAYINGLNTSVESLRGIGAKRAQLLRKMGIETLGDVLFHFPRRYEDRRRIKEIGEVSPGEVEVVRGTIMDIKGGRARNTYIIKARMRDSAGKKTMTAVWFNQRHLLGRLKRGSDIVLVGKVRNSFGELEISVREFEETGKGLLSGLILPVYPSTEGLPQRIMREMVSRALKGVGLIPDRLPEYLREKYELPGIARALKGVHQPENFKELECARNRMIFEELFLHQYCLRSLSLGDKSNLSGISHGKPNYLKQRFLDLLEFDLTEDQKRVTQEIEKDMESPSSMRRLLQGDVGSGKTLVAILAMLKAISNGFQTALMVPTEILAEQHYFYLLKKLESTGVNVSLLTGNITGNKRREILEGVADGSVNILVGTQALIQGQVNFQKLGLVIIDEQHRFGVVQRMKLTELNPRPDVLVMTATPIPRSLELTFYGDLDLSVIREMPPGRKKILTRYVAEKDRNKLYRFMKESIAEGRQAYVVCPLIEESESLEIAAAEKLTGELEKVFRDYSIGLLHGKLKPDQKEAVMEEFKNNQIDILVTTTVIEVGIDVPNANIIVIEGAERFGLAQLHQLLYAQHGRHL